MMTKWDTIQEDVKDAYAYLDEVDEQEEEDYLSSLDDVEDEDMAKFLTLDWDN